MQMKKNPHTFTLSQPYSITGSLPLVQDLKEAGYDVQVNAYHCYTGRLKESPWLSFLEKSWINAVTVNARICANRLPALAYRQCTMASTSMSCSGQHNAFTKSHPEPNVNTNMHMFLPKRHAKRPSHSRVFCSPP